MSLRKRVTLLAGLLLLNTTSACATILEARFGYFYPTSSVLRRIFDNGGIDYQLYVSGPVYKGLNVWAAIDYFAKSGRSIGGEQKTDIRIIPLSLGLKYISNFKVVNPYIALAPRYFFVHVRNHSSSVDRTNSSNGLGGVVEAGVLFNVNKRLVIDLFADYSYMKMHFSHSKIENVKTHTLQVGGLCTGLGLGYNF